MDYYYTAWGQTGFGLCTSCLGTSSPTNSCYCAVKVPTKASNPAARDIKLLCCYANLGLKLAVCSLHIALDIKVWPKFLCLKVCVRILSPHVDVAVQFQKGENIQFLVVGETKLFISLFCPQESGWHSAVMHPFQLKFLLLPLLSCLWEFTVMNWDSRSLLSQPDSSL